jgi:hypothetical protein
MADEPVSEDHRQAVVRAAIDSVCRFEDVGSDLFKAADMAYRIPVLADGWYAVRYSIGNGGDTGFGLAGCLPIIADLFGNPFRPVSLEPAWLAWRDGTVRRLAAAIYEERRFADLPVLADALEEAGCDNPDILDHCRGGGEHVRGCWVVDLILGKG